MGGEADNVQKDRAAHKAAQLVAAHDLRREYLRGGPSRALALNILSILQEATDSRFGFFADVEETSDGEMTFSAHVVSGSPPGPRGPRLTVADMNALLAPAARARQPLITNMPATDARLSGTGYARALQGFAAIPLIGDNRVVAAVGLADRPGGYDADVIKEVDTLVSTASLVLESLRTRSERDELARQHAALAGEVESRVAQRTRELTLSHRRFERLAERSPGGIFTIDLEGYITYASRRWCEITGWSDKEALGRPWTSFCRDPETHQNFILPREDYRVAPQLRFDLLLPRPDGSALRVLVQLDRFGGEGREDREPDDHTGWVGTVTDVSTMKRTESVLRALVAPRPATQEQRLRDIVRQFREALGVDFVFVTTLSEPHGETCRMAAHAAIPGFEAVPAFTIAGTPWADVNGNDLLLIAEGVQVRYPHDPRLRNWRAESFAAVALRGLQGELIGHFGFIGRRPLAADGEFEPLLRLGGAHIATELQRSRMDEERASLVAQLEVRVAERTAMLRSASEAAISAEASLRELTDSAPGAVFQFEMGLRRARLRFVSQGVEQLAGGPSHFQRRLGSLWLAADRVDRRRALETILPAIVDLQPWQVELRVHGEDSNPHWVQVSARPLKRPGSAAHWVGSAVDISARVANEQLLRTARDAAEAASRTKSHFLSTISREIRTPLHGIVGLLEMLGLSHLAPDQAQTLALADDAAQSVLRLVNNLLAYSRFEAGGVDLKAQPTDLRAFAEKFGRRWQAATEKKGLQFQLILDARLPGAIGTDEPRLRQVLDNLLDNALKFTATGGIEIAIRDGARESRPGKMRIRVRDTGVGISAGAIPGLFQPFAHAASDTNRRFGGTGLGLAICRQITDAMGGTIGVEHAAPDHGTCICLELPLVRATLPARPEAPAPPAVADGPALRKRVLVAEGDAIHRLLIARQLDHLGYDHTIVEDGLSVFWAWSVEPYDLVITDCHMPELDGYQLAKMIREEEAKRSVAPVPILALTAEAYSGVAEPCARAGMNGVMTKPATIDSLRSRLGELLGPGATAVPGTGTPGAAPAEAPWIDLKQLEAITGGDRMVAAEMLAAFLRTLDWETTQMREAFEDDDPASLKRVAHRLEGSASAVGAVRMAEHAAAIEQCAGTEDRARAAELRAAIDGVVIGTRRAIEEEQRS